MPEKCLKAVIVDLGGVLIEAPSESWKVMEASQTIDADSLLFTLNKSPMREEYESLERGETTAEEFDPLFTHFYNKQHQRKEKVIPIISSVIEGIHDKTILPEMAMLLKDLRIVGIKTALLTNNCYADRARLSPTIPKNIENHFDVVVESCRVGMRKPEYAIYRHVCNQLKMKPKECLLLDDLAKNIKAARTIGITAIKITPTLEGETNHIRQRLTAFFDIPSYATECLPVGLA